MKTLTKITLLAAGLAAAVPLFAATDASTTAPSPANHPRLHALLQKRAALRGKIAKRLDLSPDQVAQLKAKRAQTAAAVKAVRADSSLTADQKKAKVRETLQAARADLRSVLTADQQSKLDQMRKHLRKHAGKK